MKTNRKIKITSKKIASSLLFLFIVMSLSAQNFKIYDPPRRENVPEWVKVVGMYSASIALDALADAARDEGKKPLSHTLEAASVGVLLVSPFVINYEKDKLAWYLASYVSLRVSMFDPIYNTSRGLPINYVGNTSLWDYTISGMPSGFLTYLRTCSFVVGVAIPMNELKRKTY